MNALELCQQTCGAILDIDNENEEASLLMADIAFHKVRNLNISIAEGIMKPNDSVG